MKKDAAPTVKASDFKKVAECLYRHVPTGGYYALAKRAGKQIRRSLKTKDRQLAQTGMLDFREEVHRLSGNAADGRLTFAEFSEREFGIAAVQLKAKSASRKKLSLKNLCGFFGGTQVRKTAAR